METPFLDLPAHEWAYLAGIIDGEGTITLTRNRGEPNLVRPYVTVDSTDRELIDWLHGRLGGSRITKTRYADHHKQAWTWRVKDRKALAVMTGILPYLVIERKRRRAQMLVEEYVRLTPRNGRYTEETLKMKVDLIGRFFAA